MYIDSQSGWVQRCPDKNAANSLQNAAKVIGFTRLLDKNGAKISSKYSYSGWCAM
jgi:hypothetical protein